MFLCKIIVVNRVFMKYLFVILLAVASISSSAQEKSYDSLLDGEKIWTIKNVTSNLESTVSYVEYKLMEGISIDGISYKQLFTRNKCEGEDDWSEWEWLFNKAYIGEDDKGKVYYYIDHGNYVTNDVTMDFSLQLGDIFELNEEDNFPFIVTAVSDTVLENSFDRKPRKCIHLAQFFNGEILPEDGYHDVWIEGVGSVKKGVMGTNASSGSIQQLVRCTQQGNVIYQYDNCDGVINAASIIELLNYILGNQPDKYKQDKADLNGDGIVNIADIIVLVNYIAGKTN